MNLKPSTYFAAMNRSKIWMNAKENPACAIGGNMYLISILQMTACFLDSKKHQTFDFLQLQTALRDICPSFLTRRNILYKNNRWATLLWFPGKPARYPLMGKGYAQSQHTRGESDSWKWKMNVPHGSTCLFLGTCPTKSSVSLWPFLISSLCGCTCMRWNEP